MSGMARSVEKEWLVYHQQPRNDWFKSIDVLCVAQYRARPISTACSTTFDEVSVDSWTMSKSACEGSHKPKCGGRSLGANERSNTSFRERRMSLKMGSSDFAVYTIILSL